MAKVTANITVELVKPTISGADFDAIEAWIKTNIIDKLPQNATHQHTVTYQP